MFSDRSSIYLSSRSSSVGSSRTRTTNNTVNTTTNSSSSRRLTPMSSNHHYKPSSSSYHHHQQPYLTQSMLMAHCIASSGTPTITGYNLASSNIHSNSYRRNYNPSSLSSSSTLSNRYTSSINTSTSTSIGTSSASSRAHSSRLDVGQHHHASNAMRFMSSSSSSPNFGLSSSYESRSNLPPRGLLSSSKPPTSSSSSIRSQKYIPSSPASSSSSLYRLRLRERPLLSTLSQTVKIPTTTSSKSTAFNNDYRSDSSISSRLKTSSPSSNYYTKYNSDLSKEEDSKSSMTKTKSKESNEPKVAEDVKANEDIHWSSDLTRNISRNKYIIKFRELDTKPPIELRKASLTWDLEQPARTLADSLKGIDYNNKKKTSATNEEIFIKESHDQDRSKISVERNKEESSDSSSSGNKSQVQANLAAECGPKDSGVILLKPTVNNDESATAKSPHDDPENTSNSITGVHKHVEQQVVAGTTPTLKPKKNIRNLKIKVKNSQQTIAPASAAKVANKQIMPTIVASNSLHEVKGPLANDDAAAIVNGSLDDAMGSCKPPKMTDKKGLVKRRKSSLTSIEKEANIIDNRSEQTQVMKDLSASNGEQIDQNEKLKMTKGVQNKVDSVIKEKDMKTKDLETVTNLANQNHEDPVINKTITSTKLPLDKNAIKDKQAAKTGAPKKLAKKSASPKTTKETTIDPTSTKAKLAKTTKLKSPKPSDNLDKIEKDSEVVVKVQNLSPKIELSPTSNQEDQQKSPTIDDGVSPAVSESETTKRIRFREYSFEDFDFVSVLGHGGWGFVFLAELKNHEAYFAVKCIKKMTILEDDDLESMMIERKMLTLGNIHPFICKLFCTFENEAYLFFVMEYCAGGDLMFHVQKEGKFSESRCRFYAAEIICAIRFLHNRHIIYRDLKLDNILLDARGHVRLVDFGMCQCRTYREELLPSNFCGTPEYISPEIIKGVPYNHSVDWWSFGVLLYEMAVGKMPFRGSDENELLWNVCYEKIHYPLFLSHELRSLLQLLLERDPIKRLGMATCASGDIYEQPWFKGVDWKQIEDLKVEPPFVPEVRSPKDVQNFDSDFTEATPQLSPVDESTIEKIDQQLFHGFSYTNPNLFFC